MSTRSKRCSTGFQPASDDAAQSSSSGQDARAIILATLLLLILACGVEAADHRNLDVDVPVTLEDAYPIKFREMTFQSMFSYRRLASDVNQGDILVEWEYGFVRDLQFTIGTTLFARSEGQSTGSGNLHLDVLYNFNTETLKVPAFSMKVGTELPTGVGDQNTKASVGGVVTKSFRFTRIHLNVDHTFNGEERENRWQGVVGVDRPLGLQSLIIVDIVARQSERRGGSVVSLLEIGFRRQITPDWILNVGAGAGLSGDEEKEPFFLGCGFSRSF